MYDCLSGTNTVVCIVGVHCHRERLLWAHQRFTCGEIQLDDADSGGMLILWKIMLKHVFFC